MFPRLFVNCYQACMAGDKSKLAYTISAIDELQKMYEIGKYASRFIKATKCALSLLGICDDFMAEPFHRFHPPERERVREIIEPLATRLNSELT